MTIIHDKTYISPSQKLLIERGYAVEDIHSLRIGFQYTEDEMRANMEYAKSHTQEEWTSECIEWGVRRSDEIQPVMEAIAEQFICYQYEPDCAIPFRSTDWELFFWCGDLYNKTDGKESGRDYSYFTLSFNDWMTTQQRMEILDRALAFLKENFSDMIHLHVAVQYGATTDDDKIMTDANAILPALLGKKCTYGRMEGKIVQTSNGVFFMKKYARTKGYKLTDTDILRISWKQEVGRYVEEEQI